MELSPAVVLAAARDEDLVEANDALADEVGFFIVVEACEFEGAVVGGVADFEAELLVPIGLSVNANIPLGVVRVGMGITNHFGVCPPRLSGSVRFASFPSRATQYGSCLPRVLRFGRFF